MTATNTKEEINSTESTEVSLSNVKTKNDNFKQGEVITLSRIDKAAKAIIGQLRKSDQAAIEAGRLLNIEHLNYEKDLSQLYGQLPISRRTAEKLMAISKDPRLTDDSVMEVLPTSWGTLYEIIW